MEELKLDKNFKNISPKTLKNGDITYSIPVRYPESIYEKLRHLMFFKNFKSMSETIFYCIESHEENISPDYKLLSLEKTKDKKISLSIRFREKHFLYITKISAINNISFSRALSLVLKEYFYKNNIN